MTAPQAAPAAPRPRSRGRATAERILDAGEALFAERGYAGTTLRDVASAVGIRNPSLYNHFPSKDALYAAVLERGIRPFLDALSEGIESGTAPPSRQLAERMMELMARRPDLPRLIQHEALSGGSRLTGLLGAWFAPVFARARQVIEADPASRRWAPEQVPLLVLAMYHVIVGYFATAPLYRELLGEDLLASDALARQTRFFGDLAEVLLGEA